MFNYAKGNQGGFGFAEMSEGFGLLTALNVDDVPKILLRVAKGYRSVQTKQYPQTWQVIADSIETFAGILAEDIAEAKAKEPKPKKERVSI